MEFELLDGGSSSPLKALRSGPSSISVLEYDADGRLVAIEDSSGQVIRVQHDSRGRIRSYDWSTDSEIATGSSPATPMIPAAR